MEKFFQNTKNFILGVLLILFPFFFLPVTQEYFITNKFYLLGFVVLLLLLITIIQPLLTKKLSWTIKPLDLAVFLFALSVIVSIIFSSPNKIQAMTNLNFGGAMVIFLTILYFFVSRSNETMKQWDKLSTASTLILSILTIFFFFNPLAKFSFPQSFQFLSSPFFNTFGGQFDLVIFMGFLLIFQVTRLKENKPLFFKILIISLPLLAIFLTVFSIFKNQLIILPPFRLSWYAVLEILKNAKTAVIGVGPDNFSTVFTRVKDFAYVQSPLWQISSFNVGRITPLHIFVEAGILGFFAFAFLVVRSTKVIVQKWQSQETKPFIYLFVYLLICLFVFPPSLIMLFLFFVILGLLQTNEGKKIEIENENLSTLYAFSFLVFLSIIVAGSYFLGRSFLAELYFKKAVKGIVDNNAKIVYDNIRQARILNPYEERYILNFAQTNLLIASNLATKEKDKITENDRQTIAQAVQAAIAEAKTLISLHPEKAQYYENLANTYRNIVAMAQGADVWTISSYQRAIVLDPNNPVYRLQLGGVYYLLGQYAESVNFFQQAVSLKPNWSNAYYNLAWGYYKTEQFDKAANAMENVIKLVDKKTSPKDWEKANKDLESFKNKLTEVQEESTASGELKLPENSKSKLDPKLNLPPEASPEAK